MQQTVRVKALRVLRVGASVFQAGRIAELTPRDATEAIASARAAALTEDDAKAILAANGINATGDVGGGLGALLECARVVAAQVPRDDDVSSTDTPSRPATVTVSRTTMLGQPFRVAKAVD